VPGHHPGWLPRRIAEALDQSERLYARAQAVKELALPFGGGAGQLAVAQQADPVGDPAGLGIVMGDPDDGDAPGRQVASGGLEDLFGLCVQRGGGLIQQQLGQQGAG
jgi:hypothetical protein